MNLFKKLILRGIFDMIVVFIYNKTGKSLNYDSEDVNYSFNYLNLCQLDIVELIVELEIKYEIKIDDKFLSEYINVNISQLIDEVYEKIMLKQKQS